MAKHKITTNSYMILVRRVPDDLSMVYDLRNTALFEPFESGYKRIKLKGTKWKAVPTEVVGNDGYLTCFNEQQLSFNTATRSWGEIKGFGVVNLDDDEVVFGSVGERNIMAGDSVMFGKHAVAIPVKVQERLF